MGVGFSGSSPGGVSVGAGIGMVLALGCGLAGGEPAGGVGVAFCFSGSSPGGVGDVTGEGKTVTVGVGVRNRDIFAGLEPLAATKATPTIAMQSKRVNRSFDGMLYLLASRLRKNSVKLGMPEDKP